VRAAPVPSAWEHLPTRRFWIWHVIINILAAVGWAACWVLLLGVSLYTPQWVVWLFMPYFLYGPYRVAAQAKNILEAFMMRRILRTYSWQIMRDVPRGLTDRPEVEGSQFGWFEFPNPSREDHWLPMVFSTHLRTRWWARRMAPCAKPRLMEQIETVWFAGDCRFVGVVAAPVGKEPIPRRLHVVEQRIGARSGQRFSDWCATAEDIEQGRRAGVYPIAPRSVVRRLP
jgi:hypothetical protein